MSESDIFIRGSSIYFENVAYSSRSNRYGEFNHYWYSLNKKN